ncbi:MAG: hypothetical protein WD267_08235 [Balneolales bacterium]
MIRLIHIAVIGLLLLIAISCDETPGIVDVTQKQPSLSNLEISPGTLNFVREEGVKDTVITFDLSVLSDEVLASPPVVTVSLKQSNDILINDSLSVYNEELGQYSGQINATFLTTTSEDYLFYVRSDLPDGNITNVVEGYVKIRGFATGSPVIEYTDHPDTVQIPTDPEARIAFNIITKVNHPDGISNIRNVNLELFSNDGSQLGSYNMLDDGSQGDEIPGDDIYTRGFEINSSNNPDIITINIFAIDIHDNTSDTTTSSLEFIR